MAGDLGSTQSKNPIFERILIDLIRDEVSEQRKSVFLTCLDSLRRFPVALSSPAHCRILEGFTKKVVEIIEEKLRDPCPVSPIICLDGPKSWDDPIDPPFQLKKPRPIGKARHKSSTDDEEIRNIFEPVARKKTKRTLDKPQKKNSTEKCEVLDIVLDPPRETDPSQASNNSSSTPVFDIDLPSINSSQSSFSSTKKKTRKPESSQASNNSSSTPVFDIDIPCANSSQSSSTSSSAKKVKEYVPKTGSGAYAVLMTLYKRALDPSYPGFLTKDEIISQAQRLCNESFTRSRDPQGRYTAWSGVSILEKKELTTSWSRVPKKFNITDKGMDLAKRISDVERGLNNETSSRDISSLPSTSISFEQASWLEKGLTDIKYCYVKDSATENEETNEQDLAEMDIDDGVYYLIKCSKVDLEASSLKYRMKRALSKGLVLAYLHETDASEHSPLSSTKELVTPIERPPPTIEPPAVPKKKAKKASKKPDEFSPVLMAPEMDDSIDSILSQECPDPSKDFRRWISNSVHQGIGNSPLMHSQGEENLCSDIILSPDHYEVVLLVDSSEIQSSKPGGKATRREITIEELNANCVRFEKRNMNIGDFGWIARERVDIDPNSFRQREPRELVLPYLVERKRMDDLQKSIMDQRYAEQKFRMKNSGIEHLYYLVEKCGGMDRHRGIGPSALEQAMSNTVIQEGFFIHRTNNQKESMEVITTMTRTLIRKYSGVTLRSCSKTDILEGQVIFPETTLMPYKEFNDLSRKNKNFTIKEFFMKMLLQLKGLTPGMALAIAQKYPTPSDLIQALKVLPSDKEKNAHLQGLKYDNGKKIPLNVSRSIGMLFSKDSLQ